VESIWSSCLLLIQKSINTQSYKTWFEPIKPIKYEGNILTIQVPSQFFYEWLEEHYIDLLSQTIRKELGAEARLEYRIIVEQNQTQNKTTSYYLKENSDEVSNNGNFYNSKNPFVIPGLKKSPHNPQLNPNFTFESFVQGECNQLARSAGIAISRKPGGTAFNPLMVYGGVGLGKTHLIQAIGNAINKNFPNKTILYLTAQTFTDQFITTVRNGSINEFVYFYQTIDVLLMDDIQFLANKDKTQDIFFHIFNQLHQTGKQIVLTSDRPQKELAGVEDRLLSRFKWGLTCDLQVPDFETRVAILEHKMYANNIKINRDIIEYVAHHINTSVRELEGVLTSIVARVQLTQETIDIPLIKKILQNHHSETTPELNIPLIQSVVAEYYGLNTDLLKSNTRRREVVQARQIAMFFAKMFTKSSLKAIGKDFGGKDHSTVIHSCQTVHDLMESDVEYARDVNEIKKTIERQA
ncbi:MAG: chromosomal replication initiator protein DnaA, partial [Bacteroidetes bacterium]|nr:chromosomal replication initiator protein DnaA [Bacteroidota bacterium]